MTTKAGVALTPGWLPQAKDASQVAPELSAVVVYCQAVPFPGLAHALRHPRPCEMSSFSERKARKLIKEAGEGDRMGMEMGAKRLHAPDFTGMQDGAETDGVSQRGGSRGGWLGTCWPQLGCSGLVGLGAGVRVWGQRPG